jgi:hypothetical protein
MVAGSACRITAQGSTLFLAGGITTAQGQPRLGGAAYDVSTGALLPWEPRTVRASGNPALPADIASDPTGIYFVGDLVAAHGQPRMRIAKLDLFTGMPLSWRADAAGGGNHVYAVCAANGEVAVGGDFTVVGGEPRQGLASWNLDTGALLPLSLTLQNSTGDQTPVQSIAVEGTRLWIGGNFLTVNGTARPKIAAVNGSPES